MEVVHFSSSSLPPLKKLNCLMFVDGPTMLVAGSFASGQQFVGELVVVGGDGVPVEDLAHAGYGVIPTRDPLEPRNGRVRLHPVGLRALEHLPVDL